MDALDTSCPECHAKKHQPCVYIQPNVPRTGSTEWMYLRAGQSTKRPHSGRYHKAHLKEQAARLDAKREAYAQQNAASVDRQAILRANAQAVTDEQRELVTWLRQHVSILL